MTTREICEACEHETDCFNGFPPIDCKLPLDENVPSIGIIEHRGKDLFNTLMDWLEETGADELKVSFDAKNKYRLHVEIARLEDEE